MRQCFDLLCDACLLLNECGRVASTRKERRERDDEDYSSGTVVVVCCMGVNGVGSTVCVHTRTKIKGVMKKEVNDRPRHHRPRRSACVDGHILLGVVPILVQGPSAPGQLEAQWALGGRA